MTEQCDSTFRRVPLAPEFRCEFFAGHPGRKHQSRGTQWMASVDFDAADTTALFRGEPPEL